MKGVFAHWCFIVTSFDNRGNNSEAFYAKIKQVFCFTYALKSVKSVKDHDRFMTDLYVKTYNDLLKGMI